MPRSFSSAIQSEVALREVLRGLTEPAIWIAPPNSSSFSVSVVLPASGCEMIAKVRRRAASAATSGMAKAPAGATGRRGGGGLYGLRGAGESVRVRRRLAEAQDPAGRPHPEAERLQVHAAVGLHREVQVRAGAGAGAAGDGKRLPAPDRLPLPHQFGA